MLRRNDRPCFGLAFVVAALTAPFAHAQGVADFYRNAQMRLLVASPPGGVNDITARLVARHLPRFLPGSPKINVENMPGGGGMLLANRLANTLERDGAALAVLERGTPQSAILGDPNARFDAMKLTWLGSTSSFGSDAYLMLVNATHPAKTIGDLTRPGIVAKYGASGPGATNITVPLIARDLFGLHIDQVRGYPGAPAIWLAMERGELDGQIIGLGAIKAERLTQWNAGQYRALLAFGRDTRHPELPDVPIASELASTDDARELIAFTEFPLKMATPFAGPPELPPERAQALRDAFAAMGRDDAFIAEGRALKIDMSPIDGAAVDALLARAKATPAAVIERYKRIAEGR